MKSRFVLLRVLVVGSLLIPPLAAYSQNKPIRLRNEIIQPSTVAPAAQGFAAVPSAPASGLFLIQFSDRFQPAWREQLNALGADLLRFVPNDAFVARLQNADLNRIRALLFVRWVGDFRPDYKLHTQLKQQAQAAAAAAGLANSTANNPVAVSILTSPHANRFEVAELRRFLLGVRQESRLRQGTVIRGIISPSRLTTLSQMNSVLWIEPAPKIKLYDEVSSKIVGGDDGEFGTPTTTQQLGYTGAGVAVAVADTGLNNGDAATMHPDLFGRVTAFMYYGNLTDAADEHSHGTHVAGIVAGNAATGEGDQEFGSLFGLGVAPQAQIVVQRIFDGDGNFEAPPSNETLTRHATRAGAKIGSNSWGDDVQGRYDISAAEFDELVRDADALMLGDQQYILEFSAGNAGSPGSIGSPAVGKNVIATGASQSYRSDFFLYEDGPDAMADFSSRGPAEDGRIKPDVVAPGTWIASLQSASASSDNAWEPIDSFYQFQGGTSQAGPHVSGAAAVFVQYYASLHTNAIPSPALVKAALINSAVDMDDASGTGPIPNMDEGWGRVDLTELIGTPRGFQFFDQQMPLRTGELFEHHVFVASSDEPLKITMAYTDVPGFPGAIPALVNDLDLEVVGPNGAIYRGNQFDSGVSVPNAPSPDGINNVEAVILAAPTTGDYIVRVRARNVAEDALVDTPEVDQDFALVISGAIPPAGQGTVFFDRGAYRTPDQIKVEVVDADQAGNPYVAVLLHSATESKEVLTLFPAPGIGVFTNTITAQMGSPAQDGKLQIHHGDFIEARYNDAPGMIVRKAEAVADFVPPIITGVFVTNEFNQMLVTWTTDEPANSIVRYGTNSNLNLAVTNSGLTTNHSVALNNVVEGATYQFLVVSADQAGNRTTNNNGNALYNFIGVPTVTVLLVDSYVHDDAADSDFIPVSTYTTALAGAGITYNVWTASSQGSPPLSVLKNFPVVMWRISDSIYTSSPLSTLSSAQQSTIQAYVNAGGSFFMSSMEINSRLGDVPFRKNVLQVGAFSTNPDPFSICTNCDEDVGVPAILGVGNDPVSSGMDITLDYSAYPVFDFLGDIFGPDFSDTFTPATNAVPILFDDDPPGKVAGIRYPRTGLDTAGRVVFLSFPLDTVPDDGPIPNNRANFLRNMISFLAPGVNGLGSISMDSSAYRIPSQVTVEVADSDLIGSGHPVITLFSSTVTNGINVSLNETARPGLFRGFVTLVPTNVVATTNQLKAKAGDTITARYFDASASSFVQVNAVVDTQAPGITNVFADPAYQDATITWETSELADSLVQFGESPLLGRSAFDATMDTDHTVVLQGLRTDKTYYYQVVSHDLAGNTIVVNSNGVPFQFHTLLPIRPEWLDTMESGGTNWTVFDSDGTELSWTLGVPNNQQQTSAHSPTHAWGSNLNGEPTDAVETFLISPAIELTGGNRATLKFWHSYDFTERTTSDILEFGEVMIITNVVTEPISLRTFEDYTDDWEQVTNIDLTPYLGKVVYLVWHYIELSLETAPRPGWLVDDVSVTVTNQPSGAVQVTNNLAQGFYVLDGPSFHRTGHGLLSTMTNAPQGQYVIQFGDLPYYITPSPQTNTLTPPATLTFQGNYTFVDANHNGIPDSWEQQFFGGISTNRTAFTDTDGDRMTDYAEFIAGTNPTNAASRLAFILPFDTASNVVQLKWSSVTGHVYRVETSTNLTAWAPLSGWVPSAGTNTTYFVTNSPADFRRFYRVQVQN